MADIKKKFMFEYQETVKRLTETNVAAGNSKDPNGNTRIICCCLKKKTLK